MSQLSPEQITSASLAQAWRLVKTGISVIPIKLGGEKMPALKTWKPYQRRLPTEEELIEWFGDGFHFGLAAIGGAVSGNLEHLDGDDAHLHDRFEEMVEEQSPGLLWRLVRIDTPRPGWRYLYRCEQPVEGNLKLARGERPEEATGEIKLKTLIETKGEGGYAIMPDSPLAVHETGRPYRVVWGNPAEPPVISAAERQILFQSARSLNEYVEPERPARDRGMSGGSVAGLWPGEDFNQRGDSEAILLRHGWTVARSSGAVTYLRRPGKDKGHSATLGAIAGAPQVLYVFSSNAAPFEGDHGYDPFAVYTLLEHGGDYSAAGAALYAAGYGDRLKKDRSTSGGSKGGASESAPVTAAPRDEGLCLNDKGNAWRLVHQFGTDLRFCKQWGWLVWDGRRWEHDERQQVNEYAKAVVTSLYQEAADTRDDDHRKLVAAWAVRSGMKERILAMVKVAESDPAIAIKAADLDPDPWRLNVLNGTLDVRTGRMTVHRREDLITRLIPIPYDATEKCLSFEQFVSQIMDGRKDLIDYLQRWVGYCLTGDTSEQMLLFLHGMGANGKSTFLRVLQSLLGEYGKQAAPGLLLSRNNDRHPTEVADLRGARLVVSVEVGEGKKLAEELVKQMTGGDRMKGRFMHRDFFEFFPEFKLILAANHKPVIRGTDFAIWRRIPLVPFDVTFTENGPHYKDPLLIEKLMIELPGILAWAVRGCQEWRQRGLSPPAEVIAASEAYRSEMDLVGEFIADCCDLGKAFSASAAALYEAYKQWAEMNGERAISRKMLASKLKEKGCQPAMEGGERQRMWLGIAVQGGHVDDSRLVN